MYFFRTFKKSTALYKVQNMGLRYIKYIKQWTLGYNDFNNLVLPGQKLLAKPWQKYVHFPLLLKAVNETTNR